MAGMILGAVGAVVGGFFGGPAGAQLGWMIGSTLGGLMSQPKQQGPRLSDLTPQGSQYGKAIPVVYGTVGIGGNVIWAPTLIEESSTSGGKGGGPEITNYTYFGHMAVMVCEGPVSFGRIWAGPDKRLIWDGATLEGGNPIRFYSGTEDQLPDPLMESVLGVGNVPAYRGYAYVVLEHFPLAKDGNRLPFLTIEVGNLDVPGVTLTSSNIIEVLRNDNAGTFTTVMYGGGFQGLIVKNQSNHATVNQFPDDYVDPVTHAVTHGIMDFSAPGQNFIDPDRNRLCRVTPSGGFVYMDLGSGTIQYANGGYPSGDYNHIPTNGGTDPGTQAIGGCYKDGLYILMCTGSSSGRITFTALDPASLGAVWTITSDATGVAGNWGARIYSCQNGDGCIVAFTRNTGSTPNYLTKFVLTAGIPYSYVCNAPEFDPTHGLVPATYHAATKTLWSASMNSGGFASVIGADLSEISAYSASTSGGFTGAFGQIAFFGNTITPVSDPLNCFLPLNALIPLPYTAFSSNAGPLSTAPVQVQPNQIVLVFNSTSGVTVDNFGVITMPNQTPMRIYGSDTTQTAYQGPTNTGHQIQCGFWDPAMNRAWFARNPLFFDSAAPDATDFSSVSIMSSGPPGTYFSLADAGAVTAHGQSLDTVVADLCSRAGLDSTEYDTTALAASSVDGYPIATQTTVRDAITPLQQAFYFDGVESSGVLKFVPRGQGIAMTIPDDDLAARAVTGSARASNNTSEVEDQTEELLAITRIMDAELPHTVTVQYVSAATQYSAAAQYARRLTGNSVNEETLGLSLVLSDTKAAEVAQVNLYLPWTQRRTYQFNLPKSYCELEPTDVISVQGNTMRLTQATFNNGVLKMEGVFDDFNYTPHVVVTETQSGSNTVPVPIPTIVELM